MVELRRPSFHTVHLSCILVVVLLSWNYFLPLWNDAFTHLSFLYGQVTEAFPPSAFSDIRPVSFRSDVRRKNLVFPDHPIQWRVLDAPPPPRVDVGESSSSSVLENILEASSGLEAGRTYMYLVHPGKVGAVPTIRAVNPHSFCAGTDPTVFFDADPDPAVF